MDMNQPVKLTKRQEEILGFVQLCQEKEGQTPTIREICAHFGFKSPNAARDHLRALERKGCLVKDPGKARAIRIDTPLARLKQQTVDIPLYGDIPAGYADARVQEPMGCITVDVDSLGVRPTARTFALQVVGESMIGRHICDGDVVVCEHGIPPRPGDVIAALIDNESTLKTYIEKGRRPYLQAENPKYPDLIPLEELVVQGVVVALIRKWK